MMLTRPTAHVGIDGIASNATADKHDSALNADGDLAESAICMEANPMAKFRWSPSVKVSASPWIVVDTVSLAGHT
jgi:hypothetical protein